MQCRANLRPSRLAPLAQDVRGVDWHDAPTCPYEVEHGKTRTKPKRVKKTCRKTYVFRSKKKIFCHIFLKKQKSKRLDVNIQENIPLTIIYMRGFFKLF